MKWLAMLVLMLGASGAWADETLPPGFDPNRHMRVAEVRDGMKGYGLSVFKGTKIERFEVEVVSVLRNFSPKNDVVLVRMKGANLEHTGAIAGMSGSPVFLKDQQGRERMIGAFAFGWPLMKDPMGGVQPIEYMLAIPAEPKKTEREEEKAELRGGAWSIDELIAVPWKDGAPRDYPLAAWNSAKVNPAWERNRQEMRLMPLATPLMISGMPRELFEAFGPVLRAYGFTPVQGGGVGVAAEGGGKLEPGSAIAVPMMSGDMEMPAVGTCTEVLGDRVLGFGHPFLNEGDVALPMSGGYIHGVIANLQISQKLGAATAPLGTIHADQSVGVSGRLGSSPATVPIEIRCVYEDGSIDQTYRFNAALHPRFTPMLATMALLAATSSIRDLPQHHTLDYDLTMQFANGRELKLQNRLADAGTGEMFFMIGAPILTAAENPFQRVGLRKLSGTVRVSAQSKEAEILSVTLPRSKYEPGQTIKAMVRYRPFRGAERLLPVELELPASLPEGTYEFAVTDWQQHLAAEQASKPFQFTAQSGAEVFDVLRDMMSVRRDAVYLRLSRGGEGVAMGRTAMPSLPSSRKQIMMGAGLSSMTRFVGSTVKPVATEHVMSGGAQFTIRVDRELKVEAGSAGGREAAGAAKQR